MAPALSVVMPVLDAAATLRQAIDSIVAQTDRDWELVAIDDGSTDGSVDVLREAARQDARVVVVAREHAGIVAALAAGLAAARGPYIARMDADDVARPERLARQRRYLDEHPAVDLVATRVVFDGDRQASAGFARYVDWTNTLVTHDEIALARFVESPLAHPSVMFRRDALDRFGGYAEGEFPEDYELWLRWLDRGARMAKLGEPLLVWRDGASRLSRRDGRYAAEAFYRVKARYLARWLATHNPAHPDVVVWGAGRVTRRRVDHLVAHGVRVSAFVDIDPWKIGTTIAGAPVISPDELRSPPDRFVVPYVAALDARALIEERLRALGYRAGVHYIVAA